MPLVSIANGPTFDAPPGTALLDAAREAGIFLPYSCGTGRCSTCKCRVLAGGSEALHTELGLSANDVASGWILSCVRTPTTDLRIDVEVLDVALPPTRTLPCRIHALERLAPDVMRVELRLPPKSDFDYLPGQYINVIAAGGARRSYSIANLSNAERRIELHVRLLDGGQFSRFWSEQAGSGDLLRLTGPHGSFHLREASELDLVFLATGTGIAPAKAMFEGLRASAERRRPRSVCLFWGGRHECDLYLDIDSLALGCTYVPVLSRPSRAWAGAVGYVQNAFALTSPNLARSVVYACGSPAMIASAKDLLLGEGLPPHRFFSDAFVDSSVKQDVQ